MVVHHCALVDAEAAPSPLPDDASHRRRLTLTPGYSDRWRAQVVNYPVRHNNFAVVGATLGSVSLFISMFPVVGMLSWLLAPLGLLSSVLGFGVGVIRRAGRVGALWGIAASTLSLALCLGWVLLLRML